MANERARVAREVLETTHAAIDHAVDSTYQVDSRRLEAIVMSEKAAVDEDV